MKKINLLISFLSYILYFASTFNIYPKVLLPFIMAIFPLLGIIFGIRAIITKESILGGVLSIIIGAFLFILFLVFIHNNCFYMPGNCQ